MVMHIKPLVFDAEGMFSPLLRVYSFGTNLAIPIPV